MKLKDNEDKLADDSPMPDDGKYYSVKMANIPDNHLIWLYDNGKCSPRVKQYIKENLID